jgi:hypothetical protein
MSHEEYTRRRNVYTVTSRDSYTDSRLSPMEEPTPTPVADPPPPKVPYEFDVTVNPLADLPSKRIMRKHAAQYKAAIAILQQELNERDSEPQSLRGGPDDTSSVHTQTDNVPDADGVNHNANGPNNFEDVHGIHNDNDNVSILSSIRHENLHTARQDAVIAAL